MSYVTKDSGQREQFATGSQRDTREGKGRFDLISPLPLFRLAGIYERGAAKYGDHNWSKGQPFSRFLDSALRHLAQWQAGRQDEDHLGQAVWNLWAIMHFEELAQQHGLDRSEHNDLPRYAAREEST